MMANKTYRYAVIDGNQAPDMTSRPVSCHDDYYEAERAARHLNIPNANNHYYVRDWCMSSSARLDPSDDHYPCNEWLARNTPNPEPSDW